MNSRLGPVCSKTTGKTQLPAVGPGKGDKWTTITFLYLTVFPISVPKRQVNPVEDPGIRSDVVVMRVRPLVHWSNVFFTNRDHSLEKAEELYLPQAIILSLDREIARSVPLNTYKKYLLFCSFPAKTSQPLSNCLWCQFCDFFPSYKGAFNGYCLMTSSATHAQ